MKTGQHWRRGKEEKIKSWIFVSIVLSFWLNLPWEAGLRWWCTWTKSVSYHDLKKTFLSIFLGFIVFCFCSCLFFHQIIFIKSSAISWPIFFLNRINSFQKHYLQDLELQTVASFQLLLYPKLAFSSSISGKKPYLDLRRVLQLLQCITLSYAVDLLKIVYVWFIFLLIFQRWCLISVRPLSRQSKIEWMLAAS